MYGIWHPPAALFCFLGASLSHNSTLSKRKTGNGSHDFTTGTFVGKKRLHSAWTIRNANKGMHSCLHVYSDLENIKAPLKYRSHISWPHLRIKIDTSTNSVTWTGTFIHLVVLHRCWLNERRCRSRRNLGKTALTPVSGLRIFFSEL